MSDLKFSILENLYFAEHREMNKIKLQNKLIENFPAPDVYQAFKDLHEDELIRAGLHDTTAYLTKQGRIVYESVKEERAQQRKCEERYRSEKIKLTISVICNVVLGIIAIAEFILLCFGCAQ